MENQKGKHGMSAGRVDALSVGGLGLGAAYINWVSTYGSAIVTTLAILVAAVTLAAKVHEFYERWNKRRKEKTGDGPARDEHQ